MRILKQSGQSLVEYVVLLALVTIVAVSIVAGIGQRSTNRMAAASDAMSEASVATSTGGKGKGGGNGAVDGADRDKGKGNDKPQKSLFD